MKKQNINIKTNKKKNFNIKQCQQQSTHWSYNNNNHSKEFYCRGGSRANSRVDLNHVGTRDSQQLRVRDCNFSIIMKIQGIAKVKTSITIISTIKTTTNLNNITICRMSLKRGWVWWAGTAWRRRTSLGGRGTSPGSPSSSSSSSSSPPSSSSSSSASADSTPPDLRSQLSEVKQNRKETRA